VLWEILLVAACVIILLLLSYVLHQESTKTLMTHIDAIKSEITPDQSSLDLNLEELREDILDLVHETISKMSPPTAFDHILGAIASPLQAWMMRKAGINPSTGGLLEQELIED